MKKYASLFLSLLLCLTLAVSAGAEVYGNIEFPLSEETVELSVWTEQLASVEDFNTNYTTEWYEKLTNVHINWITVPSAEKTTKLNLSLASGDYPDIYGGDFGTGDISMYGGKVFISLNELMDAGYMPNTKAWFEEAPELWDALTGLDGNLYAFPRCSETYHMRSQNKMFVNKAWLAQYTEATGKGAPKTTEDFKDMLIYFRDNDMNGNGDASDEAPLMGSNSAWCGNPLNYLMSAFLNPGVNYMLATDGVVTFQANQDAWREGLKFMNDLYNEGLYAEETYVQDGTQYNALVASGIVGVAAGAWQGVFTDNSIVPYDAYEVLLPLEGPEGVCLTTTTAINGVSSMAFKGAITVACKNPEIAAQWLDFWVSKEGTIITQKGYEGTNYEIVDEPAISGATPSLHMLMDSSTGTGIQNIRWQNKTVPEHVSPEIYYGVTAEAGSSDMALYESGLAYIPFEQWAGFPLTAWSNDVDMATECSELQVIINDFVAQSVAEYVLGGRDINDDADWNAYVEELNDMGVARLVELTQLINFGA